VLGAALASVTAAICGGSYAVAEPGRLVVTAYDVAPTGWPVGLTLTCAVIADLHACEPWMGVARIRRIVAVTNALAPDVVLLLGDYVAGRRMAQLSHPMPMARWAEALAGLRAPLGVHAVLGNHDWWQDDAAQRRRTGGPIAAGRALEAAGIPVHENRAVRLVKDRQPLWIAGLGDQWAFGRRWPSPRSRFDYHGVDDLPATLRQVRDGAPVILMAHEPDVFPGVPPRVALTVSGHTHGGQVALGGHAWRVPSRYGRRYAYGHIVEDDRHLIVSGGLGCSSVPVRFGRPPEIVHVTLRGAPPS
jgi:hypothetical protein